MAEGAAGREGLPGRGFWHGAVTGHVTVLAASPASAWELPGWGAGAGRARGGCNGALVPSPNVHGTGGQWVGVQVWPIVRKAIPFGSSLLRRGEAVYVRPRPHVAGDGLVG